ncbi:hypothetical protein [Nocardia alni]|uniref:hypothetical protein n=1 Tax=Nocardia alni TaxID=2815723 RepID=UPI001C232E97|nr:hypothetical protein [Nocardia alni]
MAQDAGDEAEGGDSPDESAGDSAARNDVEKHWRDPGMYRRAVEYCIGVLVVTVLVFVAIQVWAGRREPCARTGHTYCDTASQISILLGPGLVLIIGTVGAFVATYRTWKRQQAWPIWQGAAWFMMTVTLGYLAIGAGTVMT